MKEKYSTSNVDKLLNVTQNLLQGNWSNKWIKYLTMLGDMLILHCPYISSPLRFWIVARPRLEHRIFWRKAFLNIFSLTHIMILFYLQLFSANWKGLLFVLFCFNHSFEVSLSLVWAGSFKQMFGCMSSKMSKFTELFQQVDKNKYQWPKILSKIWGISMQCPGRWWKRRMMMETIGGVWR